MNEISTEKLVANVKVLITDVEELLQATAGLAGDRMVELRERLKRKTQKRFASHCWPRQSELL